MLQWWVILLTGIVVVQVESQQGCTEQRTCADCIQTPGCAWCSKFNNTLEGEPEGRMVEHCQDQSINMAAFCEEGHMEHPVNQATVTRDEPLTDTNKVATIDSSNIIQISPQRMKLKLRKGVPHNINITYRLVADYPVDLYYLMDLSKSMADDKKNVASKGIELGQLLSNLTSQYRLGFGSFVDKVLMPFADTTPEKLISPCSGCASPYSFKNHLSLDASTERFKRSIEEAKISGNLDSPEGGFDALMQAMVCDQIGWRENARKIIVFSTDAKFHYAGDGKLAGIIKPNDEKCHLVNNTYTDYDKYDYPSIAQIDKVAKERQINIIFAVTGHERLYQKLHQLVKTSSYGFLDDGSDNLIHLVRDQYQKLSSAVHLADNSSSEFRMEYSAQCESGGPLLDNTESCNNVRPGDMIKFFLKITAIECPSDGETRYVMVNTLEDRLILEIDFECSCGCDSEEQNIRKASSCSGNGTEVCGVCHCDQGFRGEKCQCSRDDEDESEERASQDQMRCKAKPDDEEVCSGQGKCSCGTCICSDPDIHGTFCNCNRRKCLSGMDVECSGHGTCQCNECVCHTGYTGDLCQCPESSVCVAPGSNEECSGHGECGCGKCTCRQENGVTYTGRYCEECPSCSSGRCFEFRDCVQCKQFGSGPLGQDGRCDTCNITVNPIDSIKGQQDRGASLCNFEDEDGCFFYFTYRYNSRQSTGSDSSLYDIYVQNQKYCTPPPPMLAISFGLIAGIVALGVLTLIVWKVATYIHDRREYAQFEKERANAQWATEDNRLYVPPETIVQNPAYAQQDGQ